ncbi:tetratricopeptide repeat protein [Reichenbachiella ulvae]|uniref:Tetratricopeptide repeat-containing protein n=1 Tax=Reichenbachiella ulvae TaxID=2980104 RepID=A0ABT3CYL5_9BACT|nr:hypothetical protein [Reichenbachiella ulvae]MCV9388791.1 hypothetical protein [Reichenbachiella ulvae]
MIRLIIPLLSAFIFLPTCMFGQDRPVFGDEKVLAEIEGIAYYVYNAYPDSANLKIDEMEKRFPTHPVIPMMRAMNIAWQDQPIRTTSPSFPAHKAQLLRTINLAEAMLEKNPDDVEGLFFEMSAHGLLAEYFAREGSYMKSISEAKKTYDLITQTMQMTRESPEFYFLAGLYNYFREKYPERHPVYSPFMWFFKSGDKELGLHQLDSAVFQSKIVKAEAHLYTAYIYLRYENMPDSAEYYIKKLNKEYPRNSYFKAKYIESLVLKNNYDKAMPMVKTFLRDPQPYYRMCGEVYTGLYQEKVKGSDIEAERYYAKAIMTGDKEPDRGEYYRSLAYLGMGRIMERREQFSVAIKYYEMAADIDENDLVTEEAEERLDRIN